MQEKNNIRTMSVEQLVDNSKKHIDSLKNELLSELKHLNELDYLGEDDELLYSLLKNDNPSEKEILCIPDIRNKLSPITHLITVIELDDERIKEMLPDALTNAKRVINYLAQREVYNKK